MNLPDDLRPLGSSPEFDRETVPDALLSRHALAAHHWARLTVLEGELTFVDLEHDRRTPIAAGADATVPPTLPHRVELGAGARFRLEFFRENEGGESEGREEQGREEH